MDEQVALWVVAAVGAPGVLAIVAVAVLWTKFRRLRAEQRVLLPDGTQAGLIERQATVIRSIDRLDDRIEAVHADVAALTASTEAGLRGALRFQAVVRYDAYSDMGGEQSWSMAILDANRTGAVITALHARDHARVYLKPVTAGSSPTRLSPEEERAVLTAMSEPAVVQAAAVTR